jgi:hypothetical protein
VNESPKTCDGCKNRTSKWYGDGSYTYGCTVHRGMITGESSAFDGDYDAPACSHYS